MCSANKRGPRGRNPNISGGTSLWIEPMSGTDVTFPKRLLRLLARLKVRDSLKSEIASVGNSHPSETHLEVGLTGPQWLLPLSLIHI